MLMLIVQLEMLLIADDAECRPPSHLLSSPHELLQHSPFRDSDPSSHRKHITVRAFTFIARKVQHFFSSRVFRDQQLRM